MAQPTRTDRTTDRTAVDDIEVRSATEVVAHTHIGGVDWPALPVDAGVLPLAAARAAVAGLVAATRGPGYRVAVHEVTSLRLFAPLPANEELTTTVTCRPAGGDGGEVVATAHCECGPVPVANLTVRLAVRPAADQGTTDQPPEFGVWR